MNLRRKEPVAIAAAIAVSVAFVAAGFDASPTAVYGCGYIDAAEVRRLRALGLPVPPPPEDRRHPFACHAVTGSDRPRKGATPSPV